MDPKAKKSTLIGAGLGLVFSGIIVLVTIFFGDKLELIQRVGMFFGSTPAYLAARINSSDIFVTTVYLIYWIVIGGVFGLLLGLEKTKVVIGLIVVLIAVHYVAMVQLSREIEAAVKALTNFFTGTV